jgi:hypothetical protein
VATSGDYTYNPSSFQIITGAMRLIGAIQTGEVPPAEEYDDALASLNGMIHAWQANGLHVWTQTTIEVPLLGGQATYLIGIGSPGLSTTPRPLKITAGRFMFGDDETPLILMSRLDYANLSNKAVPEGVPAQYFYDPQLPYGVLTVYPTPLVDGVAKFVGQRPLQSFDTQRDTADIPQEWISALRFSLAVELGPEYDVPAERLKILKELADEKLAVVKGWDTELQGTTTLPYSQPVYQLIAGALRLAGGCGAQETPSLGMINNGFYSLNAMVKQWQGMDIRVWTQRDAILFLQPGQRTYRIGIGSPDHCCASDSYTQTFLTADAVAGTTALTVNSTSDMTVADHIAVLLDAQPGQPQRYLWTTVATITSANTLTTTDPLPSQASSGARVLSYTNDLPRPLKAPAARRVVYPGNRGIPTKIETPLSVFSRIDYSFQTNKDNSGQVTGYFFDPKLGFSEFHTWVTPGDADQAVQMTVQLPLTTYTDLTTIDTFPDEWQNAIRYNLAVEIWPEHSERRAAVKGDYSIQLVKGLADEKLMIARAWDREPESVMFGVSSYPASRNT